MANQRVSAVAVISGAILLLSGCMAIAGWCPNDTLTGSYVSYTDSTMYQSQSGPAFVTYKFVYVGFPGGPPAALTDDMLYALPNSIAQFITRQSRGQIQVTPEVILNPDAPDSLWMAAYQASVYSSPATVPTTYDYYWHDGDPDDLCSYMGALQAEILFKICHTYMDQPRMEPNPLNGAAAIIVIPYGGQGWDSPLGRWIDGYGWLQVQRDKSSFFSGTASYVLNQVSLIAGVTANWGPLPLVQFRVCHELGHHLGGLVHSPHSDPYNYGLDTYFYGNYSAMRGEDISHQGCLPYAMRDLIRMPLTQQSSIGPMWYQDPILVSESMKGVILGDIRDVGVDGRAYKIMVPEWEYQSTFGPVQLLPQYFLIAFHSLVNEDGELNEHGRPLYMSSGLMVWHICEKVGPASASYWDVESAVGRFADPGPFDAGHWTQPDPATGYDNLDVYPDPQEANGIRDYDDYRQYPGSRFDFFRADRDSFQCDEFSFRTNPNTFGREPYTYGVTPYMRRIPETVRNSICIKIREDHGTYLVVDLLLAPYERVLVPNGGEVLCAGQTDTIRWGNEFAVTDIDTVDIVLSTDGGASYPDTIASRITNGNQYVWVPSAAQVTASAKVKVVCHNTYTALTGDDESDTTFVIEPWPIAFENKSSETGLDYAGTPYSSIALDYDNDGKRDLFIAMRDEYGSLQRQTGLSGNDVPQFTDRTGNDFASGSPPQIGLRGLAAADYDNDGDIDFFAAADSTARLYHNNGGSFADSASAVGLSAYASHSWAGAWGDYDRDGQVDLYVCRAQGTTQDPTPTNVTAGNGFLLRNDVRKSGNFEDRSTASGISGTSSNASISAAWADVDGDNDLDLFVGDLRSYAATPICRLYINGGEGTFTEELSSRFSATDLDGITSVAWADMDNNGSPDLVLGGQLQPPLVFFNDGSGAFDSSNPLSPDLEAAVSGVRPLDHDLDGRTDLLVLPRETSDHPWLFSNRTPSSSIELVDESLQVGLAASTGRVDGMVAADFNQDGDADLYLGRPVASDEYFYRSTTSSGDAPTADWVSVRLAAGGGNNASAIGAKVRFHIGTSFQQMQQIDGGSGRGGQADNTVICGLGDRTGTVEAVVKWPGGFEQTATLARNELTVITDQTTPGITTGSVSGTYTPYPGGTADWVFTWDTDYSCKPSLDSVTITDLTNPPQCATLGTLVLTPSTPSVLCTVAAKSTGGYRHTLQWLGVSCLAPCQYSFTVESAADGSHKSTSSSNRIRMLLCVE